MPSIKTKTPLLGGGYYHIFNRGINRQKLFFQYRNYDYFLRLLRKNIDPLAEILAYCLIPNHFHLVIKVKDEIPGELFPLNQYRTNTVPADVIGKLVSENFRKLFISYAQAINKQENRVSSLFEAKFKRLEILDQDYLERVIYYVHSNPTKHGLAADFTSYKHSSYQCFKESGRSIANRKLVFKIFGGRENFFEFHKQSHEEKSGIVLE